MKQTTNSFQDLKIQNCYDQLTDIFDLSIRKNGGNANIVKDQNLPVDAEDEKSIRSILNNAGAYVFRLVLNIIREEVLNGVFPMEVLKTAVYYGGVVLCTDNSVMLKDAKILYALISKLTSAEKKNLQQKVNGFLVINKKNCNQIFELAKDKLEVSRSERNAFVDFLREVGWLKEPKVISIAGATKEEVVPAEKKAKQA